MRLEDATLSLKSCLKQARHTAFVAGYGFLHSQEKDSNELSAIEKLCLY